jgi:hypothetical protein
MNLRHLASAALLGAAALLLPPGLRTASAAPPLGADPADLARLTPGRTAAENALWIENPLDRQFKKSKRVVVADLKGPAEITMIHFAVGVNEVQEKGPLNRDLVLRMYWDGEATPSVECPLVDFFCDPAGLRDRVDTALVNKKRGFNCYFPMPFRKSGRVELFYDGPLPAGDQLWAEMPCYSYVMYRTFPKWPKDAGLGYFHASWRQESLLLGQTDYVALEARGKGKFIGWNVTVRNPAAAAHAPGAGGYPVDMNEKWYLDGEPEASIELQGLEDSFGFSWGFPSQENLFPFTGWFPFYQGAAAYRWFIQDAISFNKSLRVAIGFGKNEDPMFRRDFSKPFNRLQLSSTCYWYQDEPHAPLPPLPGGKERQPEPEAVFHEKIPAAADLKARGVKLHFRAGRPKQEILLAEPGFSAKCPQGFAWSGWPADVYHARADNQQVQIELSVPPGSAGKVRVFIIDPDEFQGGRQETLAIAGKNAGTFDKFVDGKWIERPLTADDTRTGKITVTATNARNTGNAVISIVEWVE